MPQRIVYSPKAWVYTKDVHGNIYDLTNYVTAGEVARKVNQVSSASVTLRNPNKIFTNPAKGVAFHPMDPITIYLERSEGRPIQVFTGYLDETPYYQMFPGTITLKASCTLKKIVYTFFDPALPYVTSFLEAFGWINKGTGSAVSEKAFGTKEEVEKEKQEAKNNFEGLALTPWKGAKLGTNEGGLAELLWGMLYYIAEWKDEKIYIEELPKGISNLVAHLMKNFREGASFEREHEEYAKFVKRVIGSGSHGSGAEQEAGGLESAGGTFNKKGLEKLWIQAGGNKGAADIASAIALAESAGNPNDESNVNDHGSYAKGLWQIEIPLHSSEVPGNVFDPLSNAKGAVAISKNGTYWHPWQTYTEGSYKKYLRGGARNSGSEVGHAAEENEENETKSHEGSSRGATDKSGKGVSEENVKGQTRLKAMEREASLISNKHFRYAWGGGHVEAGVPGSGREEPENPNSAITKEGFDCSGSVGAVLAAGGIIKRGSPVVVSNDFGNYDKGAKPGPDLTGKGVMIAYSPEHVWMTIKGRYFSTGWNDPSVGGTNLHGGAGWGGTNPATWPADPKNGAGGYTYFHYTQKTLEEPEESKVPEPSGGEGASGGGEENSAEDILSVSKAAVFTGEIAFPTVQDMVKAIALTGQKALMNDQSLLPFIQQVSQSSLRQFQSLPNGDFFAFYPDYFGEMGHRKPYWNIHNIEILDGGINLTDDGLATHVYAVGDNTWPINNELINQMFSAGTVNIFNAFTSDGVLAKNNTEGIKTDGMATAIQGKQEATDFLRRYGPRPLVSDLPMVRSPMFEMLLAYQQFLLAWSRQFITPFTFTFMPELYPGGKVGFPEHGIQMYIESVTHQWSYESGFTTTAELSAPSAWSEGPINPEIPPDMVSALVEPVKGKTMKPPKKSVAKSKKGTSTPTPLPAGSQKSELQAPTLSASKR